MPVSEKRTLTAKRVVAAGGCAGGLSAVYELKKRGLAPRLRRRRIDNHPAPVALLAL